MPEFPSGIPLLSGLFDLSSFLDLLSLLFDDALSSFTNTYDVKSITVDTFGADYGNPEIVNYEENYKKVQEIYNQYFNGSSSTVNE